MEFARPNLPCDFLGCDAAESAQEGKRIRVAGWPVARQHPKGRGGAVLIPIENKAGDVHLFIWVEVYKRRRKALNGQVALVRRAAACWNGIAMMAV